MQHVIGRSCKKTLPKNAEASSHNELWWQESPVLIFFKVSWCIWHGELSCQSTFCSARAFQANVMNRAHFFLIPRSQQAYKYLQMAVSMLVDLGLDKEPENIREELSDALLRRDKFVNCRNGFCSTTPEARGARLGCFYLSSVSVLAVKLLLLTLADKLQVYAPR